MTTGVGLTVTLRLRMGASDAHSASHGVDGARILALFGDVASELLIRLDGDEGMFRAYEVVDFVGSVQCGDYLEVTGVITKVGSTSRSMAFEARRVIDAVRVVGAAPTAADALPEPVVVCRALGTCVVPKERQRRPRLVLPALSAPPPEVATLPEPRPIITPPPHVILTPPSSELIVTASIVGPDLSAEPTLDLATRATEIADEASRCRDAGASVVHLALRNADGLASRWTAFYRQVVGRIRERTDLILQVSTAGGDGARVEERSQPLTHRPEMATLDCGTMNLGDSVSVNTRPAIRDMARRIRSAGCAVVPECFDVGHIDEALALVEEGLLAMPLHFQFVLGVSGGIGARESAVAFMASEIPAGATWSVAAVGSGQKSLLELAMRAGGHVRVGLKESLVPTGGMLADGVASAVREAVLYAQAIRREVVDPSRARQLLGIG